MLRVGIVGCGFIGTVHGFALGGLVAQRVVDARVTHVCDRDTEKARSLARHLGSEVVADVEALVSSVDVVWVCTPTAGHLEVVQAAVARGRPTFCEKPLGRDLAEAETVARLLGDVPHQVGLVLRCAPVFRRLRSELHARTHGRAMAVVFRDDQYFPVGGIYGSDWRADAAIAGGGTLIEHSIHDVDLLRWLFGEPESVVCHTAAFSGHEGVEDVATLELCFPHGPLATLTSVWHRITSRPSTRRMEVFCEDALLWLDDDNTGPLHVEASDGTSALEDTDPEWSVGFELPDEFRKPLTLYARQAKEFLEGVAGADEVTGPSAADAVAAHRLVDVAYRSAANGGHPLPP